MLFSFIFLLHFCFQDIWHKIFRLKNALQWKISYTCAVVAFFPIDFWKIGLDRRIFLDFLDFISL